MATPLQRMQTRQSAGNEIVHSEMGNGSLFTLKSGSPVAGSVGYGVHRRMHSIAEASVDGGVQTQDKFLAAALRSLGIYNETKL